MNELLRRFGTLISGRDCAGRTACSVDEAVLLAVREKRLSRFGAMCRNDICSSISLRARDFELVVDEGDNGVREASAIPKPSPGI